MGITDAQSTHAERSPGMSLATLWKHEMKRVALATTLFSIIAFGATHFIVQAIESKEITMILNGQELVVNTAEKQVDLFLQEQNIAINEHDRVSMHMDAKLSNGDILVINQAIAVTLTADGSTKTEYTIGRTVQDALRDLNVSLGEEDRVAPALDASLTNFSEIKITRVETVIDTLEEDIPYEVITNKDSAMAKGKLVVVQEGSKGKLVKQIKKVFENDKLISESLIDETVSVAAIDEIVAVGTQSQVTILSASSPDVKNISKDGLSFGVKEILDNVTLTAYDAGYKSTGKTEDHPQYGITYSGTKVEEGRTVAVDPKVIPLGWWVYIEGIGLRKAEDIGSAVKGKIIDVYMDDEERVTRFGRKRGYTVYIVGPTKPTKG